jgi:hypothetical protein
MMLFTAVWITLCGLAVEAFSVGHHTSIFRTPRHHVRPVLTVTSSKLTTFTTMASRVSPLCAEVNDSAKRDGSPFSSATPSVTAPGGTDIEGYMNPDMTQLDMSKQSRVLLYIAFALLPCLFLVPFFMSRDFVPPVDSGM